MMCSPVFEQARATANGKDVRISGGAATILQFMEAGLIEEFTLHTAPMLLGAGLRLQLGGSREIEQCEVSSSPLATQVSYRIARAL
jgi:dihydrofolate reductase